MQVFKVPVTPYKRPFLFFPCLSLQAKRCLIMIITMIIMLILGLIMGIFGVAYLAMGGANNFPNQDPDLVPMISGFFVSFLMFCVLFF